MRLKKRLCMRVCLLREAEHARVPERMHRRKRVRGVDVRRRVRLLLLVALPGAAIRRMSLAEERARECVSWGMWRVWALWARLWGRIRRAAIPRMYARQINCVRVFK